MRPIQTNEVTTAGPDDIAACGAEVTCLEDGYRIFIGKILAMTHKLCVVEVLRSLREDSINPYENGEHVALPWDQVMVRQWYTLTLRRF